MGNGVLVGYLLGRCEVMGALSLELLFITYAFLFIFFISWGYVRLDAWTLNSPHILLMSHESYSLSCSTRPADRWPKY